MSEEILINVTPPETRVALVENGVVHEVIIERTRSRGIVGNVYKGRVCRVLPGMQAAFVDIGLERAAFLHASDIAPSKNEHEERSEQIMHLVREGEIITVQVTKDPLGTKGARLTSNLSIPSRNLVYMPGLQSAGISQRIEDEKERDRLRNIIEQACSQRGLPGNYIVRTAAEGLDEGTLLIDVDFLDRLWRSIQEREQTVEAPGQIHEDLPLAMRALRDLITPQIERIRIDSKETWQKAVGFARKLIPDLNAQIEHYKGTQPIFGLYGIENEIQKALERKVELKSGGYLIVDQTEAMTTIDVNTGAFVGHRNLNETIYKTNLEAAQAICRQLRLRNLGGIIIIDFIDMSDEEHKRQVMRALEKCLTRDHAKTHITDVSLLGLVEMTRKRTRESLEHVLCEPCSLCGGRGSIKTTETTCYEIFREVLRESCQFDVESMLVLASQEVVDRLLDEESSNLANLESFTNKTIKLQAESLYSQEHFDIVLL